MDRASLRTLACLVTLCVAVDATASGFRPFARDDSMTVVRGGEAVVLDSGRASVLDNDFDWERDPLTAVIDREPRRGSLELRPDGTFVYRHDGSGQDSDSFRYRAFDGTGYSRAATVSIDIEDVPNAPPRVVGDVGDQEAAEGAFFELELATFFDDPDPDDVLSYSANGLPNSGSLSINAVTGVLSGTPVPGDARDRPYDVRITARDRLGASATLSFDLYIIEDLRADVSLDVRVVTNPIGVGETSRWEILVENNGPGPLEIGVLTADWVTAGPALSLTSPGGCSLSGNNTSTPALSCNISALPAGAVATIPIDGVQADAGDNSLIGVVTADDPKPGNNSDLASAQVVAAFSEGPTQVINFAGADIDAGDLNGDGEIDIAVAGSQTTVYFNNGNRALTTPGTSLGADSASTAVTLLDWNGDGHLDIAAGGMTGRAAEIFVNDGAGVFTSAARLQANVGIVNDIVAADLDLDGQSELVIAGSASVMIARGSGLSSLSTAGAIAITAGDLDLDGDQDIVTVRASDRSVRIYANNGTGTSFGQSSLQAGSVGAVSMADINADGAPDLLLGLDGSDLQAPKHRVFYQQGTSQFSAGQTFGASAASGLLAGDVNGDGWNDVAAINQAGVHQVYLGASAGNLSLAAEQLVSSGTRRGVLVDFNSDQSLDLVLVGANGGLEIHANNGIGRLGLGDRISPDLKLLGEATMQIPAGAAYIEPGVTAVDDIDGDITDQVVVTGTVNTTEVGAHRLTYTVSDRAGNEATVVRTVQVGVNKGTGGSGGGAVSPWLILLCTLLAARRRRSKVTV